MSCIGLNWHLSASQILPVCNNIKTSPKFRRSTTFHREERRRLHCRPQQTPRRHRYWQHFIYGRRQQRNV